MASNEVREDDDDDLPQTELAEGLVSEAGLDTPEAWQMLAMHRLRWLRSWGEPPAGIPVELVDG